ncbi:MAG: ATP-binding protein [Verrucomicrobia bacterium]|nr:ATP-binding protein [Verrucomicrobiota bacterium]
MIFNSIRWRLQAWHGLILVAVLAGFGFTAYQVARDNQLRRIDQDLDQRLMALLRPQPPDRPPDRPPNWQPSPPDQRPEPPMDGPRNERRFGSPDFLRRIREAVQQGGVLDPSQTNTFYYVLWQQDGSILASSPGAPGDVPAPEHARPARPQEYPARSALGRPGPAEPGPPMLPTARTRGQLRELFRVMPQGNCILVGRHMTSDLAAMRRLSLWLVAAGTAVLLLGLAGGWWVATHAIRPIEDISATAVKIAAGDLSQRINAADTDSELGRLAGVLNSTFARLEAAFTQQARFTSDASHELRTPVSVILTQTQTALSRERASSEYREALEACQRAARRMRALTESLLELARLDAGQEPMKRESFDLPRVARECVEMVRPLAAERGIQIHCEVPPLGCLGDAGRISQVVTNLLTNAIHFNRDQGEVRLSARAENRAVHLTVADTGQGIPAEDIPHLFERFYRADKSRSRIQGRNGLGLAICKAIIDAHGGTIEVSSQPGTGSTFTVKLPSKSD